MIQTNTLDRASRIIHYTCPELSLFIRQEDFDKNKVTKTLAHQHEDFECMQVCSGTVHAVVNGKDHLLHAGDIIFINAMAMHQSYLDPKQDQAFFNVLLINQKTILNPIIAQTVIDPMVQHTAFSCLIIRKNQSCHKSLSNLIEHMVMIQNKRYDCYLLDLITYTAQLLKQIYIQFKHTYAPTEFNQHTDHEILNQMVDFIYDNYQKQLSLDEISASANVSNSTACRLFKKYLQQSPINYLNAYRLEVGCQLLKNSDASIAEISGVCGFNQQSYFNRLFRRTYAMTPLQYRLSDLRATTH